MTRSPKNRYPYRKAQKPRPTLKAILTHRPPNPGRTAGGIGWEYVYPTPELCRRAAATPDEDPGRYDVARPGKVGDGEGP